MMIRRILAAALIAPPLVVLVALHYAAYALRGLGWGLADLGDATLEVIDHAADMLFNAAHRIAGIRRGRPFGRRRWG